MPRAIDGPRRKERRKKILDQASGYWGRRSKLTRTAKDTVRKAGQYSYRDRKVRKRDFRQLWIARISAATRAEGLTYSRFISGLSRSNVLVNRKVLSNMAVEDPASFKALVETARKGLDQ
jgi:large subunit ribosomal protein L20